MTPLQRYHQYLATNNFYGDPNQEQVVRQLEQVFDEFVAVANRPQNFFFRLLKKAGFTTTKLASGFYLWGSVGAGKTWLMDIFYESLPGHKKKRWHFHRFMQQIHHELTLMQGHRNPLRDVARRFAKRLKIICLDEFLVTDITDAMILAGLLEALFAEGITLVTTANLAPDDLYRYGLQRDRFLPAIDLLKHHLRVIHLEASRDYRLRPQKPAGNYFFPLNEFSARCLQESFAHFAHYAGLQGENLTIAGRLIPTVRRDQQVVWFEFRDICAPPRSQLDYLEIARRFSTIIISNVPQITAQEKNAASYFIKLVDVFYDARVNLILSAAVPVAEIYRAGELSAEFNRTLSRLIEMQGKEYLHQHQLNGISTN